MTEPIAALLIAGDTFAAERAVMRKVVTELALADGICIPAAIIAGAYGAAHHRQWVLEGRPAGMCDAGRREHFDAEVFGDALAQAALAACDDDVYEAMEAWVLARLPHIGEAGHHLLHAEQDHYRTAPQQILHAS
jgi:hypothetical protein